MVEGAASREEKVAGWEVPAAVWNLPTASREEKTAWDLATASREEAAAMGKGNVGGLEPGGVTASFFRGAPPEAFE